MGDSGERYLTDHELQARADYHARELLRYEGELDRRRQMAATEQRQERKRRMRGDDRMSDAQG